MGPKWQYFTINSNKVPYTKGHQLFPGARKKGSGFIVSKLFATDNYSLNSYSKTIKSGLTIRLFSDYPPFNGFTLLYLYFTTTTNWC